MLKLLRTRVKWYLRETNCSKRIQTLVSLRKHRIPHLFSPFFSPEKHPSIYSQRNETNSVERQITAAIEMAEVLGNQLSTLNLPEVRVSAVLMVIYSASVCLVASRKDYEQSRTPSSVSSEDSHQPPCKLKQSRSNSSTGQCEYEFGARGSVNSVRSSFLSRSNLNRHLCLC